ncbi:MAG: hypothetical protein B9S32_12050 [Verrucomicrobia bacterium Tous-C9LFEB]|nr:MAG: hypothetical protein B9S32_12050 [Verrucomicrobia bacterium Tous-C9LFEB]
MLRKLKQSRYWAPISWVYRNSGLKARVYSRSLTPPVPSHPLGELLQQLNSDAPLRSPSATSFTLPEGVSSGPMPQRDQDMLIDLLTRLNPETIFEFGTNWGVTTSYFVENTNAKIWTLDICREMFGHDLTGELTMVLSNKETGLAYRQLKASEGRVTQVFRDSLKLDWTETEYPATFDLILVDACHAYDFVKSDTEKALSKLRPGGLLLWHDFYPTVDMWPDVFTYVSEFAKTHSGVLNIKGTALAAWVKPH